VGRAKNADSFARRNAISAWRAAKDANFHMEEILARLDRIETLLPAKKLQRCGWCGEYSLAPVCAEHLDLMTPTDLYEQEALGG